MTYCFCRPNDSSAFLAVVISVYKCRVAREVTQEEVAQHVVPEVIARTRRLMLMNLCRLGQDAGRF